MKRCSAIALALFTTVGLCAAQGGEKAPQSRVERRAEEMREGLGTGKHVKSHVRVRVRLANGNRLQGVVKDGKLVERVTGLRFVDADASEHGAGIRLWYSGGTRNYVFVPFESLAEYEVLEQISAKDLALIENELKMDEARRAEQQRRLLAERKAAQDKAAADKVAADKAAQDKAKGEGAGQQEQAGEADAASKQKMEWRALLDQYPPDQGWNQKKRDEIKNRFVVIGARPSEVEQRFVDKFAEWLAACAAFGVDPNQGAQQEGHR
jgi:hypothetical protein